MTEVLAQPALMHSISNSPPMDHSPPTSSQPRPYASQAQMPYTPPSSGDSPESYSPISPRTQWNVPAHLRAHSRQLRPPKSPMYVPAVLRPTEKPIKQSPPKGSRLSLGTIDGGFDIDGPAGMGDGIVPGLSRIVTEEWNEEILGQVTGPPSRNHWKPDSTSIKCDDPACDKVFSFFERRHHCRRCGKIYCGEHSGHEVPLDQHARFHPHAAKYRACNPCWSDYRTWEVARVSRSNSTNSRDSTTPSTPNIPFTKGARTGSIQKVGSLSTSRDWNWSTF